MTTDDAIPRKVLASLAAHSSVLRPRQVFVVAQTASGSLDLLRLLLTESLLDDFMRVDARNSASWAQLTPMQYVPGRSIPGGHVMWVSRDSVTMLRELNLEDDASRVLPAFDLKALSATNLKMTITTSVSANDPTIRATFFRVTRNTAVMARTRRFAAVYRNGAFDSLKEEVLLFNDEVDAIALGDFIYFSNRHTFERSFGFLESLRARAADTFTLVTRDLKIDGFDELRRAATTDINMMAKMASIRRKLDSNPRYATAMTMGNLLKFIDSNPHVDVPIVGTGDNRRLEFHASPSTRWKILKLLDDDFLKSGLTFLDYEVDSKGDPI